MLIYLYHKSRPLERRVKSSGLSEPHIFCVYSLTSPYIGATSEPGALQDSV